MQNGEPTSQTAGAAAFFGQCFASVRKDPIEVLVEPGIQDSLPHGSSDLLQMLLVDAIEELIVLDISFMSSM